MKELFDDILKTFENEDIKEFAKKCIDAAPDYFYHVGASSTGKYHPQYALGEGGLVRHTLALLKLLNHMFNVESINQKFTSRERDLLRTAGIVHDMWKSGTQEEYEQIPYTKFDHPLRAAKFVWNMNGLSEEERKYCSMAISSHMGQWNTDKRNPGTILPKPETDAQIILHLADYLASRKDIEMKFNSNEQEDYSNVDINTWPINFGKYKGMTLIEINEKYPYYIQWLKKEGVEKEPCKTLIEKL